jgi:hypothetical protein
VRRAKVLQTNRRVSPRTERLPRAVAAAGRSTCDRAAHRISRPVGEGRAESRPKSSSATESRLATAPGRQRRLPARIVQPKANLISRRECARIRTTCERNKLANKAIAVSFYAKQKATRSAVGKILAWPSSSCRRGSPPGRPAGRPHWMRIEDRLPAAAVCHSRLARRAPRPSAKRRRQNWIDESTSGSATGRVCTQSGRLSSG